MVSLGVTRFFIHIYPSGALCYTSTTLCIRTKPSLYHDDEASGFSEYLFLDCFFVEHSLFSMYINPGYGIWNRELGVNVYWKSHGKMDKRDQRYFGHGRAHFLFLVHVDARYMLSSPLLSYDMNSSYPEICMSGFQRELSFIISTSCHMSFHTLHLWPYVPYPDCGCNSMCHCCPYWFDKDSFKIKQR